jgi:hypothetical protein
VRQGIPKQPTSRRQTHRMQRSLRASEGHRQRCQVLHCCDRHTGAENSSLGARMEVRPPATGSGTRELDDAIRKTSIVALILKWSEKSIHKHRKKVLESREILYNGEVLMGFWKLQEPGFPQGTSRRDSLPSSELEAKSSLHPCYSGFGFPPDPPVRCGRQGKKNLRHRR